MRSALNPVTFHLTYHFGELVCRWAMSQLQAKSNVEVASWIRGYHAYKDCWEVEIGQVLTLQQEPTNPQDKNAIAIIKDSNVVGHMPKGLASTKTGVGIIRHFLSKAERKGEVEVTGKSVNRGGGYGMEVPCIYKFTGQAKYTELLEKLLDFDNNLSVRKEIAGKKRRFEQDQPEAGDKKKKNK